MRLSASGLKRGVFRSASKATVIPLNIDWYKIIHVPDNLDHF